MEGKHFFLIITEKSMSLRDNWFLIIIQTFIFCWDLMLYDMHVLSKVDLRSAVREAMGWLPYCLAVPGIVEEATGSRGRLKFWKPKWRRDREQGGALEGQGDRDPVLWTVDREQPLFLTSLSFLGYSVGRTPMEKFCSITRIGEGLLKGRGEGGCSPAPELN